MDDVNWSHVTQHDVVIASGVWQAGLEKATMMKMG